MLLLPSATDACVVNRIEGKQDLAQSELIWGLRRRWPGLCCDAPLLLEVLLASAAWPDLGRCLFTLVSVPGQRNPLTWPLLRWIAFSSCTDRVLSMRAEHLRRRAASCQTRRGFWGGQISAAPPTCQSGCEMDAAVNRGELEAENAQWASVRHKGRPHTLILPKDRAFCARKSLLSGSLPALAAVVISSNTIPAPMHSVRAYPHATNPQEGCDPADTQAVSHNCTDSQQLALWTTTHALVTTCRGGHQQLWHLSGSSCHLRATCHCGTATPAMDGD